MAGVTGRPQQGSLHHAAHPGRPLGAEHGGNQCTNRTEAGEHYADLIAAGVTLPITDIRGEDDTLTAKLQIARPDPEDHPTAVTVRLTLRDGLIADIRELDPPPAIELLYFDDCPKP